MIPSNINLDESSLEVKRKGGTALNTDCVVCEFDEFPFQLDNKTNIIGYYHDEANLFPKYKLEGERKESNMLSYKNSFEQINVNIRIITGISWRIQGIMILMV